MIKQSLKIILTLTVITAFILVGITFIEPMKVYGQSKVKIGLPQKAGRDPFLLPPGVRLLSQSNAALGTKGTPFDISPPPLTVKAILISDRIRLASIDRYILTVGDSIGDEKVLEIKTDRVVLGKGDEKRTLLLSQSPIRLTVEEKQGEKR